MARALFTFGVFLIAGGLLGLGLVVIGIVRRVPARWVWAMSSTLVFGPVLVMSGAALHTRPSAGTLRAGQAAALDLPAAPGSPPLPPLEPSVAAAVSAAPIPAWTSAPGATRARGAPPLLPGLDRAAVQRDLEREPFRLRFDEARSAAGFDERCGALHEASGRADAVVCLYSSSTSDIAWLEARVVGANAAAASWLFPLLATLPFDGNHAAGSRDWAAAAWSQATAPGRIYRRELNGVTLEVYGSNGSSVFLDIAPSDLEAWLVAHP